MSGHPIQQGCSHPVSQLTHCPQSSWGLSQRQRGESHLISKLTLNNSQCGVPSRPIPLERFHQLVGKGLPPERKRSVTREGRVRHAPPPGEVPPASREGPATREGRVRHPGGEGQPAVRGGSATRKGRELTCPISTSAPS